MQVGFRRPRGRDIGRALAVLGNAGITLRNIGRSYQGYAGAARNFSRYASRAFDTGRRYYHKYMRKRKLDYFARPSGRARKKYKKYKTTKYKKGKSYKKTKPFKRRRRSLKTRVNAVEKAIAQDRADYKYHVVSYANMEWGTGKAEYFELPITTVPKLKETLQAVPYTGDDGKVANYDLTLEDSKEREIHLRNVYAKVHVKNPTNFKMKVDIYAIQAKLDTTISPLSAMNHSLEENLSGYDAILGERDYKIYPTTCNQFNKYYKIVGHKRKTLAPGAWTSLKWTGKEIGIDLSILKHHNLKYQQNLSSCSFFIRAQGDFGHVEGNNESITGQGITGGKLLVNEKRVYHYRYDGGADMNYTHFVDSHDFLETFKSTNYNVPEQAAINV